jgi:hypothetical protein
LVSTKADGARLVAVFHEEVDGLVDGPGSVAGLALAGMELDRDDEAGVAQQSVLELAQADQLRLAELFGRGVGGAAA